MAILSVVWLILSSYFRRGCEGRSGWSGKAPAFAGGTGVSPVEDDWFGKDSLLRLILSSQLREEEIERIKRGR